MADLKSKKILLCGATGFIGKNLLHHFLKKNHEILAVYHHTPPIEKNPRVQWIQADLTNPEDADRIMKGVGLVLQAAATTSGAKEIVSKPYYHVTDNAVMNSLLFRACHQHRVERVIFFSCTVMYPGDGAKAVKESDFNYQVTDKYFGAGWTKVYLEKMCEFYSKLGPTRYTAIRHSNIYGPHDKFDLERSHVFGASITKVMTAPAGGKMVVWGDGSEERDLLYVGDLLEFIDQALARQQSPYELVNVGSGTSVSVRQLVEKIIQHSGKNLEIEFDRTKPTIPFKLRLNIDRAQQLFQWKPRTSLDEGIRKTLDWFRNHHLERQKVSS